MIFNECKKFLKDYNFCFKCCDLIIYIYIGCSVFVKCDICGNRNYFVVLYVSDMFIKRLGVICRLYYGGEEFNKLDCIFRLYYDGEEFRINLSLCCIELCGKDFIGRFCFKIILVRVYFVN